MFMVVSDKPGLVPGWGLYLATVTAVISEFLLEAKSFMSELTDLVIARHQLLALGLRFQILSGKSPHSLVNNMADCPAVSEEGEGTVTNTLFFNQIPKLSSIYL